MMNIERQARLAIAVVWLSTLATGAFAQSGISIVREAPPSRQSPPAGGLVPLGAPPPQAGPRLAVKFASVDFFGDESRTGGGSLFAVLGLENAASNFASRISIAFSVDPVVSVPDASGARQTGVGDIWVRSSVTAVTASGARPRIAIGYAAKIPTGSESKGLGSGHVDHQIGLSIERAWKRLWSQYSLQSTFKGAPTGVSRPKIASASATFEVALDANGSRAAYQGFLQVARLLGESDYSSFQQHGVSVRITTSPLWLGGGGSWGFAGGEWNPGGYVRLEWRP